MNEGRDVLNLGMPRAFSTENQLNQRVIDVNISLKSVLILSLDISIPLLPHYGGAAPHSSYPHYLPGLHQREHGPEHTSTSHYSIL